jgi:transcriptional regulator with GAF, ATPase, and Fis domain
MASDDTIFTPGEAPFELVNTEPAPDLNASSEPAPFNPPPDSTLLPARWSQLADVLSSASNFHSAIDEFITQSPACIDIKRRVTILQNLSDTVLIIGASGTGKELLARALHHRPASPFIAVNCAALPDTLFQSILFGHKKGSFTGAVDDRLGAFEAAGMGTLFLDEIGDMPMHQQPALLRALQQREITPLGSTQTTKINCRIVAATNNDPRKLFREGLFREDLFARLMTFILEIPSFYERKEDVALIAKHLGADAEFADSLYDKKQEDINKYGARAIQAYVRRYQVFGSI